MSWKQLQLRRLPLHNCDILVQSLEEAQAWSFLCSDIDETSVQPNCLVYRTEGKLSITAPYTICLWMGQVGLSSSQGRCPSVNKINVNVQSQYSKKHPTNKLCMHVRDKNSEVMQNPESGDARILWRGEIHFMLSNKNQSEGKHSSPALSTHSYPRVKMCQYPEHLKQAMR